MEEWGEGEQQQGERGGFQDRSSMVPRRGPGRRHDNATMWPGSAGRGPVFVEAPAPLKSLPRPAQET